MQLISLESDKLTNIHFMEYPAKENNIPKWNSLFKEATPKQPIQYDMLTHFNAVLDQESGPASLRDDCRMGFRTSLDLHSTQGGFVIDMAAGEGYYSSCCCPGPDRPQTTSDSFIL
jgi:hypothetical protein